MKRKKLHDDWSRLGKEGVQSLDIPHGTVTMTDGDKTTVYRLDGVYVELLKEAYMRGLKQLAPW
jgi:hypothetical protein